MSETSKGFGWRPDLPDGRDLRYGAAPASLEELPASKDLRPECPPVYDQGELQSCTANAVAAALEFDQIRQGEANPFTPSRLFVYYNTRAREGTTESDPGSGIRDAIKSVVDQGACLEETWPYDESQVRYKPSAASYAEALDHQALRYLRLNQTLFDLKSCLAAGFPFAFGFSVFANFLSPKMRETGHLELPRVDAGRPPGHAVLAVGYDEQNQWFVVRNSWGAEWGLEGYFTMPYPYLLQPSLAGDFWTIRKVETGPATIPPKGTA
jgi:C1A family cysteine protease